MSNTGDISTVRRDDFDSVQKGITVSPLIYYTMISKGGVDFDKASPQDYARGTVR